MELTALKFASDTTELERAAKVISGLITDVSKLDKVSRDAAKTEEILAKAAKANADANLANAKAQDQRLKSTITADKADQANEKSQTAKTKALESHTKATKENVSILQRQTDIYDYQTQGFSKGQASILATAKATGQWSKELERTLELQRQFSSNTFDNSETGYKRMVKAAKEAADAQTFFNEGFNLTTKQARELSNDLERLNAGLKQQGKSYQEISKAQAVYKQQFLDQADAVNKANNALTIIEKQRKDVVAATNYVTKADQQMAAALNQSNAALDKGGTDSLVRYETALRKSGVSQELATSKLKTYKAQLEQVQKAEMARREQFLSRAIMPQVTDVAVSLWSGQNPLTVLLQQGGQVTDLFNQSGIAAEKFGESVKTAMKNMLPSILTVVKGVGGLMVDGFMAAGNAVTGFLGRITGFTAASEQVYKFLASDGPSIAAQRWAKLSDVLSKSVAVGFTAVIAVLIAMAIEYKNIVQAEAELSKALAVSGGAMAMSKDQAVAYAESMKGIGVGTLKAMDAITEFTKVGKIGKDGLDLIIKSAIDLEKYAGVSISETAKKFSELQDEPTKALIKFAESNGYVSASVLDTVASLEQQGDKTKAATVATEAMRVANNAMADEAKSNLSPIEKLWLDIKSAISSVKQEIYDLTTSNESVSAMRTVWQTLAVTVSEFWYVLKGVGKELGGIAAQIGTMDINAADMLNPAMLAAKIATGFNNDNAKNIRQQMIEDAKTARAEQDKLVASIMAQGTEEKKNFSESKEQNSQYAAWRKDNEKALERQFSKEERLGLKKKQLQNDLNAGIIDEIKYKQALAGWERIIMGEKKPKDTSKQEAKELDHYADILNKVNGLSSSYNNELANLQKLRASGRITEEQYIQAVEDLIKLQPFYIKQQKEINDAHELSNKLLGKTDQLGKDYYTTLEKIQKFQSEGLYSAEQADKLRQAAFDQTQLAKENLKYIEESNKTYNKYAADTKKSLDNTVLENQKLDDRLALLGLTSEQQKYMKIEQQQRNALLVVEQKLQQKIADIREDMRTNKIDPFYGEKAIIEAEQAAAEERKNINKEVAVQYREDFQREFIDPIRNGITDSIVTALFEGGKAGSKKLREVLVNILRQKVTIVVDAVVNTLLGNVVGSIFGGSGGGSEASGGSIGNLITSGLSALNSGVSSAISSGFTNFAMGPIGQRLGLSAVGPGGMGPPAMTGLGSSIGTGLGMAGNGLAGYGISRAISGGYTTGGNTVNILAGIASAFFGPIAGVIGGIINRLFGRKLADVGIEGKYNTQEGFSGNSYTYYKGGLLRSDKTVRNPLDSEFVKAMNTAFTAMITQVGAFAEVLGLSTKGLENFSTSFKISTNGLTAEQSQAKVQEALATANNEMAQEVLGTWKETTRDVTRTITGSGGRGADGFEASQQTVTDTIKERVYVESEYAKEGEKAIETLTRLATSLSTVNQVFDTLGYTMYESSLKGGDMASKLADLFGGLDKFVAATTAYYQNFYSESERQATALRQLDKEFKAHNLTLPKTREEYRKLVEAQDLTTEEGRKMYAWLIQLAPAFVEISQSAADIAAAAEEARKKAVDAAFAALESAVNAQKEILQAQEATVQTLVTRLQGIFDLLDKNVKELYMQVDSTAGMLADQGRAVIQEALNTGSLPDVGVLSDAISAVRGSIDSTAYTTQFEQDKARLQLAADLKALQDEAGEQLSVAELTLRALKDQIEYLDKLLASAKLQIDALNGINTGVLSVAEALEALRKAMFPDKPAPGDTGSSGEGGFSSGPSGGSSVTYDKSKDINEYLSTNYQGTSDLRDIAITASLKGWTQEDIAKATGYNVADIEALFANNGVPKFADGGAFTNGVVQKPTRFNMGLMGESGSEAIMPLTNVGGKLGVASVSSEDSTLADRVGNLEFALQAIAVNTGKMARILDGAQGEDGRSLMTSAAPV